MFFTSLSKEVAQNLNLSEREVKEVLKEVEGLMYKKIVFGQEIVLREIGKLELKITKKRKRYNVSTKQYFDSAAKYRLSFKASKKIDERLAQKTVFDGEV